MKENAIEKFLFDGVKARGGRAVKLVPTNAVGIPDRLVLLPGLTAFVELKRPKSGVVAEMQLDWQRWLISRGNLALILSNKEQVSAFLEEYDAFAK